MRLLMSAGVLLAAVVTSAQSPAPERARNVILFLADAGGLPTINAASIEGYGAPRRLFVQQMPFIGLSETSTASEFVTDSAAGMTAIVTGERTHNGVLGQSAAAVRGRRDGLPLKTILEHAEERGLATGLISNDSLAGATPAALYAKANERNETARIFTQAFEPRFGDGVDVMIGAGRREIAGALAEGGSDLRALEAQKGRRIFDSLAHVPDTAARPVVLLDDEDFDVTAATLAAIRLLSKNPNGYFLMVESDVHTHRLRHGLRRMVAFDRTIATIASRVGTDTLILFTADHSFDLRIHNGRWGTLLLTGLPAGDDPEVTGISLPHVRMVDSHTSEEVLVAAQGPGAERVRGVMANTDLFRIMMSAFGWAPEPPVVSTR